jgi:hypothetical protein
MTMVGYSDDAKVTELLAPLRRLEPVPFVVPERAERRLLRRPVIVAAVLLVALALTGVAIANGVGAFDGISAAQNTPTGTAVLPPGLLAQIRQNNAMTAEFEKRLGRSMPGHLLPDTARVLGTMPDGAKVYGLTDTLGELCLIGEVGGSCGLPLSQKHPITFGTANEAPTTGGMFIASGVAIDGIASVSFSPTPGDGTRVTVRVKNNVWVYKEANSHADDAHCIAAHMADGSTVNPFPEVPCP